MNYNIIYLENIGEFLILKDKEYEEIEIDYNAESLVQRNLSLLDALKLKAVLRGLSCGLMV